MSTRTSLAVIWLLAAAGGVWIAVTTRLGPVVLLLPGDGHGLHVGDLVGLVAVSAVGAAGSWYVCRAEPTRQLSAPSSRLGTSGAASSGNTATAAKDAA